MNISKLIRDSFRLRRNRKIEVRATQPFAANAPTKDLERVDFPVIKARMVKCSGPRKRALFYEKDFYSQF